MYKYSIYSHINERIICNENQLCCTMTNIPACPFRNRQQYYDPRKKPWHYSIAQYHILINSMDHIQWTNIHHYNNSTSDLKILKSQNVHIMAMVAAASMIQQSMTLIDHNLLIMPTVIKILYPIHNKSLTYITLS